MYVRKLISPVYNGGGVRTMESVFVGLELLQRRVVLSEHLHHHFNTVSEWEGKERSILERILQL